MIFSKEELANEKWRPVIYQGVNFKGFYYVSNLGRFLKRDGVERKIMATKQTGRIFISLTMGNVYKSAPAARIIANTFYRELENGEVADHINNNPIDDRVSNIQIITYSENSRKDRKNISVGKMQYITIDKSGRFCLLFSIKRASGMYERINCGSFDKLENVLHARAFLKALILSTVDTEFEERYMIISKECDVIRERLGEGKIQKISSTRRMIETKLNRLTSPLS